MLKIHVGSSLDPREVTVSPNATLRDVLAQNNMRLGTGAIVTLDSRNLGDSDLDKTMADLGAVEGSFLTSSQKMNSGK